MNYKNIIKVSIITSALLTTTLNAQDKKVSLDTVTVTAQKSEENVQDVPMSVDVFDDVKLEDYSISTLEDIGKYTPNLLLFNTGERGWISPSIRGSVANISTFSSPVSLYVDGVPTVNTSGFNDPLMDIERIEVLKGPQGTLYGKNSQSGVINIITKKPNNETRGKIYTELGNDGKREYGLTVSGPLVQDKFYAGFSYKHYEKDGFITNSLNGEKVNYKETDYGKLNLRYTPTDNLDISFITTKNKNKDGGKDWAPAGGGDNPTVAADLKSTTTPEVDTYALSIDYTLDKDTKLKSITTKSINDDKTVTDSDMGAGPKAHYYRNYKFENISQEFRLEKNIDETKIVTGLYFSDAEDDLTLNVVTDLDPTGSYPGPQFIKSKTYSIFSNVIHPLDEKWTVNGGLRYDKEEKEFEFVNANIHSEDSWNNISPKLSLQYNIDKDSMTYATVAKGYISGGFNPYRMTMGSPSYDEESLISYELGYKSMHFDNRLKLNGAIYYMDISDMQVQRLPTSLISYMENAASATSKGIELDLEALLTDELTLFTAFGFNETKFDEYNDPFTSADYRGNYNLHSPKYNFNIGLQYRHGSGFYARADLNGYGRSYYNIENTRSKDPYEVINAKIGYEADDYDIYLYADNLFDENLDEENAYFQGTGTIYREDREVGIKLTYRF